MGFRAIFLEEFFFLKKLCNFTGGPIIAMTPGEVAFDGMLPVHVNGHLSYSF